MSMLAEKKRREKWCLNPRGKAWSEDQTKFGQKLLEKMGWSAGQGLGINNQGPTEIVKVRKKDDNKGLGFKDNGEEWLKTTSDFNKLLDQLGSSMEEQAEQTAKTLSLEDRSRKSKARVHYHKFTRGKDLSRYSKKDLASIIGPIIVNPSCGDEIDNVYTGNQINRGNSDEYFNSKKKTKDKSLKAFNTTENSQDFKVEVETSGKKGKKRKREKKEIDSKDLSLGLEFSSQENNIYNNEENQDSFNERTTVSEDIEEVSKKTKKKAKVENEVKGRETDDKLVGVKVKSIRKKNKMEEKLQSAMASYLGDQDNNTQGYYSSLSLEDPSKESSIHNNEESQGNFNDRFNSTEDIKKISNKSKKKVKVETNMKEDEIDNERLVENFKSVRIKKKQTKKILIPPVASYLEDQEELCKNNKSEIINRKVKKNKK